MQVNTTEPSSLPILGPQPQQQQQKVKQPQQQPRKKQLTFIRPAQMSLFARVSCYPPLGEVTCPSRVQKAMELEKDDMVSIRNYYRAINARYHVIYIAYSIVYRSMSVDLTSSVSPSSSNPAAHSPNNHGKPKSGITSTQLLLPTPIRKTIATRNGPRYRCAKSRVPASPC